MKIPDDEFYQEMQKLHTEFGEVKTMLRQALKIDQCFDGEKMLENADVCRILNITKRTLARYRQHKMIAFHATGERGKCYYKPSDVEALLERYDRKTPEGQKKVNTRK